MFFVFYEGEVYCVKVFSKEGIFLYDIGREGFCVIYFKGFFGFVVDRFNNLIVCDYESKSVWVFMLDGKFVNEIGEKEFIGNLVFWFVVILKNGLLFIINLVDNCIYVFEWNLFK